jgi:hypothetical protein
MFLYGCSGSPEVKFNEVARDFNSFAIMHLTCTMFITTDSNDDKNGGVFHRILDPKGKSTLLRRVDKIFSKKVGPITLKQYLQERRNRLATHRTLSHYELSAENQAIVNNPQSISNYYTLMEDLEKAVYNLLLELIKLKKIQSI